MLRTSTASPTGVPVAWHSTSETVSGATPAAAYASPIARSCPSWAGLSRPRPRPSLDSPMPRITPRTGVPPASASASRIRATNPAPSPCSNPSASRWKGRLRPDLLTADRPQNPTCRNRLSTRLTAPASIRSAVLSCRRSHASLIAYSEEAQAASSAKAPAPRPSARAAKWAGSPEEKRLRASGRVRRPPVSRASRTCGSWAESQTCSAKADPALVG